MINNVTYVDGYIKETVDNNLDLKNKLRERRRNECFPIINRGILWYNKLNNDQYAELNNWYDDWLRVTETLIAPNKPIWLDYKLSNEEDI